MFEYYGWASVSHDTFDIEDEEAKARLVRALWAQIETVRISGLGVAYLTPFNSLLVTGLRNHRFEPVIDLFRWLAENGPGSYGLLHVRDHEDYQRGGDYQNVFRVWRLARGRLEELDDPFLSPCLPVIEDFERFEESDREPPAE